jgi:hypothetical protein
VSPLIRRFPGPVVFRAAAGPRLGFGHLIRCRSLARAMGVDLLVSLRGTQRARLQAAALGARLVDLRTSEAITAVGPSLVVIDDPSRAAALRWLARARRAGVPVASVHDRGLACLASDLVIDGGVRPDAAPSRSVRLAGPAFTILDPVINATCRRRPRPVGGRILLSLGGGRHVVTRAARLSAAIAGRLPHSDLRVARGFSAYGAVAPLPHGRWIDAPDGLVRELAGAQVAIVAGGMTLYEACALGVPVVAVGVTDAQRVTVRALARAGAVLDGGLLRTGRASQVADAVAHLIEDPAAAAAQAHIARQIVDGRGAARVATHLRALAWGVAQRRTGRAA